MVKAADVWVALDAEQAQQSPQYRLEVIRAYLLHKVRRHRSKVELQLKLIPLERTYPHFADTFQTARLEFALPASPVVGAPPPHLARAYHRARAARTPSDRRLPITLDAADLADLAPPSPPPEFVAPPPAYEREDTEATIRDLQARLSTALEEAERARARLAEAEEARRELEERVVCLERRGGEEVAV
ncbi:uncharacterized protein LOC62_05G007632 [Vanrija pseudolonga]|uniref:Uncharacterized protein n=1 Tax=Vanrija pseudolonga TaxID=143232 RepID=A0AAF0YCB7_9TREE|nr:hypothetical protein LOC62_05G007632 [Vanrija pseudolonga]